MLLNQHSVHKSVFFNGNKAKNSIAIVKVFLFFWIFCQQICEEKKKQVQ